MYSVEELCRLICNKIYSSTREGYGIFYEDEFLDILPDGSRTRETLEAVLKQLANGGYIDVKYARGNAFCMLGLNKYEESEKTVAAPPACDRDGPRGHFLAWIFAAAFAGGAVGGIVTGLIFYAV